MIARPIPPAGAIFVFGSNTVGRHGKGAALTARQRFGAVYGQGNGRQGQSYAIPTKVAIPRNGRLMPLSLSVIEQYVAEFLGYARAHADLTFYVTRVGCGLAGYDDEDVAPLFKGAPENCLMPPEWSEYL